MLRSSFDIKEINFIASKNSKSYAYALVMKKRILLM